MDLKGKIRGKYSSLYLHVYGTICHQISFSQHWIAFKTLIHKSPVGVKKLFSFFCVTYRLKLMLNYQVMTEVETRFSRLGFVLTYLTYKTYCSIQ